ncbi:MAG: ABC transporter permease, partial [Actinomycetota bacterium]
MTVTLMDPVLPTQASTSKRTIAAGTLILFGLIDIFLFGLFAHSGDATFALSVGNGPIHVPSIEAPAAPVCYVLGALSLAIGLLRASADLSQRAKQLSIGAVLLFFVICLLCWAYAGSAIPLNAVNLLQSTLNLSIPLVLGALAGCMCERSGVINIVIEGQLLVGAFAGAVVASAFGALWLGLITGALAGGLLGLVLAVFAIRFFVDQIILGVVLNVLASGLTGYLNDRILVTHPDLNAGLAFNAVKIPGLGDIPIIGPIFFDSSIFLYIMYALI